MTDSSAATLDWNALRIAAEVPVYTPDGYCLSTEGDNWTFGNPVPVTAVLTSLLRDGDLTRTTRWGNREAAFVVSATGPDLQSVALAEKALSAQVTAGGILTWQPPDYAAYPTVFEVQTATMDVLPDDINELRVIRRFQLTLTCMPWGRSQTSRTATFATGTSGAATTIDDGSSATKWGSDAYSNPTPTAPQTSVTYLGEAAISYSTTGMDATAGMSVLDVTWSGSAGVFASSPYIGLDVAFPAGRTLLPIDDSDQYQNYVTATDATGYSNPYLILVGANMLASGYTRFIYKVQDTAGRAIRLRYRTTGPYNSGGAATQIAYVGGLYSVPGGAVNGLGISAIEGSVRTSGSLVVSRSTSMAWCTVYADPTMLTNSWSPASSSTWANAPAGQYTVYVTGGNTTPQSNSYTAVVNGQTLTSVVSFPALPTSGIKSWAPLGKVTLTARRDGTVGTVTITNAGGTEQPLTNYRIFRDDPDASLFHFPGLGKTNLTLDAPSADMPFGFASSDGVSVLGSAGAWDPNGLTMPAGTAALFVDADGTDTAPVTRALTYYPRWYHNAAAA